MSMWLYQMNQAEHTPGTYRLEIWEGQQWKWPVGSVRGGSFPEAGDTVVFFYAKSKGIDPGVYGWAVVMAADEDEKRIMFRPVSPSDRLKMTPWWDEEAEDVANAIRGGMKQGTLFLISAELQRRVRAGVNAWLATAS